jgi:heme oxygenase
MENELLADHLKAITSGPHQELEKVLIQRMRAMRGLDDYIQLLQAFYGYFGAVEARVNTFIGSAELPDYLLRRKSESLATDILSLGGSLPEKAAMEQIQSLTGLWGNVRNGGFNARRPGHLQNAWETIRY